MPSKKVKKPAVKSPKKNPVKSSPKLKKLKISIAKPKSALLESAHAALTLSNFATLYISVTVQANVDNGKVSQIGFACEQSPRLLYYLQVVGEKMSGKTPEEVEQLQLKDVLEELSPSKEERLMVVYAFSAWQDVISRLPTPDPLSGALQAIKYYHREFPRGTLLPDLED